MKIKKARHNKYAQNFEAEIDLHGLTKSEAAEAMREFIEDSRRKNYRKVRVITGKGLHSENGHSVLNDYIKSILDLEGLEYTDAKIYEGGSGAVDIKLEI